MAKPIHAFSIYITLLKSIMGSGILKFPFMLATCSFIPLTLANLISIIFAYLGIYLYTKSDSSIKNDTFDTLTNIVVFLKCIFVFFLYIKLLSVIILNLMDDYVNSYALKSSIVFLGMFMVIKNEIRSVNLISAAGVFAILAMLLSALMKVLEMHKIFLSVTFSFDQVYRNAGFFVFSYSCHQNILNIQKSAYNKEKVHLAALYALITAGLLYTSFAYLGLMAYKNVSEDIFEAIPNDLMGCFIKVLFCLSLYLTIPMQTIECKRRGILIFGTNNVVLSIVLCLVAAVQIFFSVKTGFLFNIIGGGLSSLINFIFPSYMYLRSKESNLNFIACITGIFGVVCIIQTVTSS